MVGNETLLRSRHGRRSAHRLHRSRARADTQAGVDRRAVAIWLKYPQLAKHVDFITVHLLPYWEGYPRTRRGRPLRADALLPAAERVSRQAHRDRRSGLAVVGRSRQGRDGERRRPGVVHPPMAQRGGRTAIRLLHRRSVRPALQGIVRRPRRRVLGFVRRRARSEILAHRTGHRRSELAVESRASLPCSRCCRCSGSRGISSASSWQDWCSSAS